MKARHLLVAWSEEVLFLGDSVVGHLMNRVDIVDYAYRL